MQLLIVHDDVEVGEQLVGMLKDYTSHQCDLVESDAMALRWAQGHDRCGILLAQLQGSAVDGLALGGLLGETFPGLQTIFLPSYPASDQRIEIARTRVFPEPIDGERLLEAIEAAAEVRPEAPDFFQVLDVLQMCCLGGRTGALQLVKQTKSGIVYLRGGKIVHAESPAARGTGALLEITSWDLVEFAYDESVSAPETISFSWDEALLQEIVRHKGDQSAKREETEPEELPEIETGPQRMKRAFLGAFRR
jgi:hypothetical protein